MRKMIFLALMMMAGCGRQVRDIKFPDAATSGAEQGAPMNQKPRSTPPESEENQVFVPPTPSDAGHRNSDANEMAQEKRDSGHNLDSGFAQEAGEEESIDAASIDAASNDTGSPDAEEGDVATDAGTPLGFPANELWTMARGLLVIAQQSTRAEIAPMPWWSRQAAVSGIFRAAGGRQYYLLIYERRPGEQLMAWMARAEVGDSVLARRRLRTANQMSGFVYETGDYGASPFVHITVASAMYVYVFYTDDQTMEVPLDFVQFVEGVSVQ